MKTNKTLYFTKTYKDEESTVITVDLFGKQYIVNEIIWKNTDPVKSPSLAKHWVNSTDVPKTNAKQEEVVRLKSVEDVYNKCPVFNRKEYMETKLISVYKDDFLEELG